MKKDDRCYELHRLCDHGCHIHVIMKVIMTPTFSDRIDHFYSSGKPSIMKATKDNRDKAIKHVMSLRDGGGTDIDAALKAGLQVSMTSPFELIELNVCFNIPLKGGKGESRCSIALEPCHAGHFHCLPF